MKLRVTLLIIVLSIVVGSVYLLGTRNKQSTTSNISEPSKLEVITSVYPIYDFTKKIGGDRTKVTTIVPSGVEPHDYEPTPQDIVTIQRSQLLLVNGGVEPWAEKIQTDFGTQTKLITVGEGIMTEQGIDEKGHTIQDPHIWLNPTIAKLMVKKITSALSSVDISNQSYYQSNATRLEDDLTSLDQKFREGLRNCKRNQFVTSHAAFIYLAKEYNLQQIPISGLSPEEEPSAKQLADIANFIKKNNIKYIFFETLVSPKLSETLSKETGAQTLVLNPIEGLTPEEQQQKKDYFSLMQENLKNLKIALECQ